MEKKNTPSANRDGLLFRSESRPAGTTSSDFVLQCQWGNRKRSRCSMKVHIKDPSGVTDEPTGSGRAAVRLDRRVGRSDLNNSTNKDTLLNKQNNLRSNGGGGNGYLNLRQRPASPSNRLLRNSESPIGMRGHSNGVRGLASPERKGTSISNYINKNSSGGGGGGGGSGSSETAHEGKKGGSSSGGETIAATWPPKFVIALTNKEKEEDFMILKGSKLPLRPKKRAKFLQRTLNLVSPGAWLCDLTLERYEVREKKVTKKRPRGLKAMGLVRNVDSESE